MLDATKLADDPDPPLRTGLLFRVGAIVVRSFHELGGFLLSHHPLETHQLLRILRSAGRKNAGALVLMLMLLMNLNLGKPHRR